MSRFLSRVAVVEYGVLGTRMGGAGVSRKAAAPDRHTCIVDPAGLPYIQDIGPGGAGGAAGVIYDWLGIRSQKSFPQPVKKKVSATGKACYHAYSDHKHVIHVVGPDFRVGSFTSQEAINELATAYQNVLAEFASVPDSITTLRLLPVSGGIFSGRFSKQLPLMTAQALEQAFEQLSSDKRDSITADGKIIQMCIFMENEYAPFRDALTAESHYNFRTRDL